MKNEYNITKPVVEIVEESKQAKVNPVAITQHRSGEDLFKNPDEKFQLYRKEWEDRPLNFNPGNFPLFIDIETTNACNFRCTFCSTTLIPKDQQVFIDEKIVYKIIDEGKELGLYGVKFNMRGEPTLHPKLCDFVRYAVNAGLIDVYFNTNGSRLTDEKSIEIIESGLTRITFSFEGYEKEYYEKTRVRGNFESVVGNIRRFYELREELKSSTPKIRISGVLLPEMKQNLDEYIKFWQPYADQVSTNDYIEEDEDKHRLKNVKSKWACNQLWQRMGVWWDGTILSCNQDYFADLGLGNLNEISLKEAWESEFHNELRDAHRLGQAHLYSRCNSCSFRPLN